MNNKPTMYKLGGAFFVLGFLMSVGALFSDTTVSSEGTLGISRRSHNIGKISDREAMGQVGAAFLITGAVFVAKYDV